MRVLKHIVSGLLFEATPALLKNKKMIPASPAESEAYMAKFSDKQKEALKKNTLEVLVPEDFDLDTDIFSFGKAQLMEIAPKLGCVFPSNIKVKDLKAMVEAAMAEARVLRDEQRKRQADSDPADDDQ